MLKTNVPLLSPVITCITLSYLCFESIFLQVLHPPFDVVCCWGVWLVFIVPHGHPGPQDFVHFSMTASAMAQQPFWTVLTLVSTWTSFPAQLTDLANWNPTFLVSPRGSPSLSKHLPKNKIASPGARTTISVIFLQGHPGTCQQLMNWSMHEKMGAGHLLLPLKSL